MEEGCYYSLFLLSHAPPAGRGEIGFGVVEILSFLRVLFGGACLISVGFVGVFGRWPFLCGGGLEIELLGFVVDLCGG